ncbi:DinB family protein [Pedobacter boryungensis]|uniref:DinB family protein n=1 Tax=Pedobacter boryungensis TaxID=869962 RepID=A0ABX2D8N8_9SPHI|nr:DinB family protein [Pedobacter boryungensis]NQX30423.1 DinB family protein [Pedobacter boryungensis]
MIATTQVLNDFNTTFSDLENAISLVEEEDFNCIPFPNSWTAGQVVQHIILASAGFSEVLNAKVKPSDRAADELIPRIKTDFLNFDIKMKSPDFILPEEKMYDKVDLLKTIKEIKTDINKQIETLDLTQTCLAFELPVYGFLTRLEAIYFVIYHTQRHSHQLNNIAIALSNKP